MQLPDEVPEGLGENAWWGSGGFRGRYLVRFRKVPVQTPCEVLEGFWRRRCLVRFWRVPVQIPCEAPEGSGADAFVKFQRVPIFFYGIST